MRLKRTTPFGTLGFLVYDVARMLRRESAAVARRGALPQSQWRALLHLTRMQGCRQHELADVLEVRAVSLGRVLDRLERAGLVQRRADPSDRRARLLFLTRRADGTLRQVQQHAAGVRERAMLGVSAKQEAMVVSALEAMRRNLQRPAIARRARPARPARPPTTVRAPADE